MSVGRLPSSRLFGSLFCFLTPATSCGSADHKASCVWCVRGRREALASCLDFPTAWGASVVDLTLVVRNAMCRFGQLGLKEGGNGESHKWSGLILFRLYFQERLKVEVFQPNAYLSRLDWPKRSPPRDSASFLPVLFK